MADQPRLPTGAEHNPRRHPALTPEVEAMLARARDKLQVARLLLEGEAWSDAASRAYYAVFDAVSALHLAHGKTFSTHSQLIGMFNKEFVLTERFPKEFTSALARLFEDRQSGDYDVLSTLTEQDARQDVDYAANIIDAIKTYLEPNP